MKERVKSVLHYKKPALWIVIAAVAICVILAICFLTNPAKEYRILDSVETTDSSLPAEQMPSEEDMPVNDNYYSMITDISRTEVEDYANYIKQLFMEHDWLAISSEIAYPITISGTTYTDSTVFLDASDNIDSNLNEDFFSYLKEEDCVEMFINSQGIMLGATGQVWIADVLDDKSNSHGLKIITINDLLKE